MSDFVVRGIDADLYRLFKARLVEQDLTFGEWLVAKMMREVYASDAVEKKEAV